MSDIEVSPVKSDPNTLEGESQPSNLQRRLKEALAELPEPFPTTREKSVFEKVSRHASALRYRLDQLVRREDRYGEDQPNLHRTRAERNALTWALRELIPDRKPEPQQKLRAPEREYVRARLEEAANLMDDGYREVRLAKPGLLFHHLGDDIAPAEVSLVVWFYVKGRSDREDELAEATCKRDQQSRRCHVSS